MTVQTTTAEDLVEEIFLIGRVLRGLLSGGVDASGMPPALIGVLYVLAHNAPCRQNELAVSLCVSQSSLSRQIAELVDAGLVVRHPDPADGRASLVELSEQGRQLLVENKQWRVGRLLSRLDGWSQEDAQEALTALRRLKNTFTTTPVRAPATGPTTPLEGGNA